MKKQINKIFFLPIALLAGTVLGAFLNVSSTSAASATLYAPYNGVTVKGAIQLSTKTDIGDATGLGVGKVEYYINGSLFKTYIRAEDPSVTFNRYSSGAPTMYAKVWDTSLVPNGSYTVSAIVYDSNNNPTATTPSTVMVSNTPNIVTIPTDPITVRARQYVTNIVHIPGGHYAAPYVINTPNTEYILDGDIEADATAIIVNASKVVINLNGHTVKYNQTAPGEGIVVAVWNKNDIAIINGAILQGWDMCEGDVYGGWCNPIGGLTYGQLFGATVTRFQVSNIYMRYGGRDVSGIKIASKDSIYENNIIVDTFTLGNLKNRHQGVDGISGSAGITVPNGSGTTVYRNNTLSGIRHRGINPGNYSEIYGNNVTLNSLATNATAIPGGISSRIHDNIIVGRGQMPLGIFAYKDDNVDLDTDIYNNYIDVQTTAIGEEYGASFAQNPNAIIDANNAYGFRTTWGGNGIKFHDNVIIGHSKADYAGIFSPTGALARINGGTRGIEAAILAGDSSDFYDNTITVDGDYGAEGISVQGVGHNGYGDNTGLLFRNNNVTSTYRNVALGGGYGAAAGWPLFIANTFIKADNARSDYGAIGTGYGYGGYAMGTGRFVSNSYQNGASQETADLKMYFGDHSSENNAWKSLIFGRLMNMVVKDSSGNILPNAAITTHNQGNNDLRSVNYFIPGTNTSVYGDFTANIATNYQVNTDSNGAAQVIVYDYELHDVGSASAVPIHVDYNPHIIGIANLFTTQPDSSGGSWDALSSSGTHTLTDANGSIIINTDGGQYTPPSDDVIAPSAPHGLSIS